MLSATVTLNDEQIKALGGGEGVTVIAAPGENKAIVVFLAVLQTNFVTTAYTGGSNDAAIVLGDEGIANVYHTSPILVSSSIVALGENVAVLPPALRVGADLSAWEAHGLALATDPLSKYENKPVVITDANVDGPYTGGNAANTLKVTVFYALLDV